jgi:vancomycin resistance protein YoaR
MEGSVLMPGETFSFNAQTGKRTWEKGYRMAHIFETKPGAEKAEVVEGLGGGICQVSSTLYNAVREANKKAGRGLKIVERQSHSLPVTYVPSGWMRWSPGPIAILSFATTSSFPSICGRRSEGADS